MPPPFPDPAPDRLRSGCEIVRHPRTRPAQVGFEFRLAMRYRHALEPGEELVKSIELEPRLRRCPFLDFHPPPDARVAQGHESLLELSADEGEGGRIKTESVMVWIQALKRQPDHGQAALGTARAIPPRPQHTRTGSRGASWRMYSARRLNFICRLS